MNVYEKLQLCRIELHGTDLKKTGWNDFSKYAYFQLGDYLMPILSLFSKYKLFGHVSFTEDMATLKVIDTEDPTSFILFTSPLGSANLKGCHVVQNIGAVELYQRRYLYQMALEIIEHDALELTQDATTPYSLMDEAEDLPALQAVFKESYRAETDKKEKESLKKHYDKLKKSFVEKPLEASE